MEYFVKRDKDGNIEALSAGPEANEDLKAELKAIESSVIEKRKELKNPLSDKLTQLLKDLKRLLDDLKKAKKEGEPEGIAQAEAAIESKKNEIENEKAAIRAASGEELQLIINDLQAKQKEIEADIEAQEKLDGDSAEVLAFFEKKETRASIYNVILERIVKNLWTPAVVELKNEGTLPADYPEAYPE